MHPNRFLLHHRGSDPSSPPPDTLAGFKGSYLRQGKGGQERKGKRREEVEEGA